MIIQTHQQHPNHKASPFLLSFNFNIQHFDVEGDKDFGNLEPEKEKKRGGYPYYSPVMFKRFGLNVSGKYDNGNNRWLQKNGKPGEWAVAYHGVRAPKAVNAVGRKTLNLIMDGLENGSMLKPGPGQGCNNQIPKNRPQTQKVGNGVYFMSHIQDVLCGYIDKSDEYGLILQCRVNPKAIKICSSDSVWVVNDSKDIRPYGIILVDIKKIKDYPTVENQFNKRFKYEDYKQTIDQYLKIL